MLQPNCAHYKGSQENNIPWKQQVVGMAGDAFWNEDAPVFFQQIMDQVLEGANFLKCYIADVLMHSKGLLQHLAHFEELFTRLHEVNMKIHL